MATALLWQILPRLCRCVHLEILEMATFPILHPTSVSRMMLRSLGRTTVAMSPIRRFFRW